MDERPVKFFNAGDRIQCMFRYTDPTGHDIHCIANYLLDAPANEFFSVPRETGIGGAVIPLTFHRDIMRDFGPRGVVMVDANHEPIEDSEHEDRIPIAKDDRSAKEKGARVWKAFVLARVKEFMEQCEMIRAAGGVPRPATGAMVRYLRIQGVVDPSEAMLLEAQKQTKLTESLTQRLDRLEAENRELRERIPEKEVALAGGKGKSK